MEVITPHCGICGEALIPFYGSILLFNTQGVSKSVTTDDINDLSGRAILQNIERSIRGSGKSHTLTQLALAFFLLRIHKTTHAKREGIPHCRMLVVLRFFPRSHSQTGTAMKIQHPVSASCSLHPCSSVPVCMSARFGAPQDKHSAM